MSRACGQTPEHTPLRVQSSACPREHRMADKARTPPCATYPHAQNQDEHRNHHDEHEPYLGLKAEDANNTSNKQPLSEPKEVHQVTVYHRGVATPQDNN